MLKSSRTIHVVAEIAHLNSGGPWDTKSGGKLNVLFNFSQNDLHKYYPNSHFPALSAAGTDLRGLRAYTVTDLSEGSVGANEWHELRTELVFTLRGEVRWDFEDVHGGKAQLVLKSGRGLYVPPTILHTYTVLKDATEIMVIADTTFDADNLDTHDSFSMESFREFQDKNKR